MDGYERGYAGEFINYAAVIIREKTLKEKVVGFLKSTFKRKQLQNIVQENPLAINVTGSPYDDVHITTETHMYRGNDKVTALYADCPIDRKEFFEAGTFND